MACAGTRLLLGGAPGWGSDGVSTGSMDRPEAYYLTCVVLGRVGGVLLQCGGQRKLHRGDRDVRKLVLMPLRGSVNCLNVPSLAVALKRVLK